MNVTASGTIDANSTKALIYVAAFGKMNPKKNLLCNVLVFLLVGILCTVGGVLWRFNIFFICLISISAIVILINLYLYFIFPIIRIKKVNKLIGSVNTYEFRDDCFSITTTGPGSTGTSTLNYDYITKVFETNDYLFLVFQNNTAFVVEKKDIQNNENGILQKKLECQIPKYVRCNY